MLNFSMAMGMAQGNFRQFGQDCSIGQSVDTCINQPLHTSSPRSLEPDIRLLVG